jgi:glycosyltransferase involved in cell wall biosynthesis
MRSKVSIIVPAYNAERDIPNLIQALQCQTVQPLEAILVDDCSIDRTKEMASAYFSVFSTPSNSGPAAARNIGIRKAKGDYLGFLDADCRPEPDWVEQIETLFQHQPHDVFAGGLTIKASSIMGKAIAALGYPGGGSLGFDKMWPVAPDGSVEKICTANLALRRRVVEEHGGFDESFDYCFEDAWFAYSLIQSGVKIVYAPTLRVEHASRERLGSFIKWHYRRGKGIVPFKQKVGKLTHVWKWRIWSTKNMVKAHLFDLKLPLILFLFVLSFCVQQVAYRIEKWRKRN